jgi:hypothetical protein
MATSDGDVIMSDVSNNGDAPSAPTSNAPATATTAPSTAPSVASTSQSTRTDHDRQQYFFLPKAPLKRSRPHVSQNLIADYGLNPVHDRVRRVDPATGEKINKLRKSYVGIVKGLRIAGSNKEVPTLGEWLDTENIHDPQGLMDQKDEMQESVDIVDGMQVPRFEKVWKVDVKPVTKQAAQGLLAKLGNAVQMVPGKLEEGEKWRKLLGDDAVKKPVVPLPPSLKAPAASSSARPSPRMGPMAGRTQRTGAKRTYDESSYSGYRETFDEGESDLMRKKQRKVPMKSPKEYSSSQPKAAVKPPIVSNGSKQLAASIASKWKMTISRSKRRR